jgi:hypothetical protein
MYESTVYESSLRLFIIQPIIGSSLLTLHLIGEFFARKIRHIVKPHGAGPAQKRFLIRQDQDGLNCVTKICEY